MMIVTSIAPDGAVDGSCGAGRERDRDDLAAFAFDSEGAVPAFDPQAFDVCADRFRDTQAVEGEQAHERMVARAM